MKHHLITQPTGQIELQPDAVEVSGVIHLRNNASYDIGITW